MVAEVQGVNMALTSGSKGPSYVPPICGSLRSLYRKWAPLRWAPVPGVNFKKVDSTNKCNRDVFEPMWLHAKKYLRRGSVAKAFSGFIIERESQILERAIRHLSEVRFLGKSPADETIGVLIGSSLPRAVRVGKVEFGLEFCRNILMPGKLGPVV